MVAKNDVILFMSSRPHPGKDALRYQIRAARDFLALIGVTP
jgi:hypothetical protein